MTDTLAIDISIDLSCGQYWVVIVGLGYEKSIGPYSTESDARVKFDALLRQAESTGGKIED